MQHESRNHKLLILSLGLSLAILLMMAVAVRGSADSTPLRRSLKTLPYKIAWECYVNGNLEIFVMNADGSGKVNLTNTPGINEHYSQISPDAKQIAYSVDTGEGREAVRTLWVMDIHGKHKRQIADHAREPFWSPGSKTLGYLPQEYAPFKAKPRSEGLRPLIRCKERRENLASTETDIFQPEPTCDL